MKKNTKKYLYPIKGGDQILNQLNQISNQCGGFSNNSLDWNKCITNQIENNPNLSMNSSVNT